MHPSHPFVFTTCKKSIFYSQIGNTISSLMTFLMYKNDIWESRGSLDFRLSCVLSNQSIKVHGTISVTWKSLLFQVVYISDADISKRKREFPVAY